MSDAQLILDFILLLHQDSCLRVREPFSKATISAAKVEAELSAFYFESHVETTLLLFGRVHPQHISFHIIICWWLVFLFLFQKFTFVWLNQIGDLEELYVVNHVTNFFNESKEGPETTYVGTPIKETRLLPHKFDEYRVNLIGDNYVKSWWIRHTSRSTRTSLYQLKFLSGFINSRYAK